MLERRDLEEHIAEIKNKRNQTESECIKLAAFVILRDELQKEEAGGGSYGDATPPSATVTETVIGLHGDSDFLRLVSGRNADHVWSVMAEAMESLKLMEPRFYAGILRKLNQ